MTFKANWNLEWKRLLNKKNSGLLLVLWLLCLYFVQLGVSDYKSLLESKENFQETERLKVKRYTHYGLYGTYGLRLMFMPSPAGIFFVNSSTVPKLSAHLDSGQRLYISSSFKGKGLFFEKAGGYKDFGGILLLLGSLLSLALGYEAFLYKDYLRFLAGDVSPRPLFSAILLVRSVLLILFFAAAGCGALLLTVLNGIRLSYHDIIYLGWYFLVLLLVQLFFLAMGAFAGACRSPFTGLLTVAGAWFLLVFLVPGVISAVIINRTEKLMSNVRMELEWVKRIMKVEDILYKKYGASSPETNQKAKPYIEQYWNKEFKELQALQEELQQEVKHNIRWLHRLSLLAPSSFYLSTGEEIGGKGYVNAVRFFDYVQQVKKDFVRYILDRKFHTGASAKKIPGSVENFIKKDENVFHARSSLPHGFPFGLALTLLYILGLLKVSYTRFKRALVQ